MPKPFKAYEPGYVHLDAKLLPQMADKTAQRDGFVASDRATRWVFIAIESHKTAAAAKAFLNALHKAAPFKIHTLLTDNGREFTAAISAAKPRTPRGSMCSIPCVKPWASSIV